MLSNRNANLVIIIVTLVWVANFVASLAIQNYDGTSINGIFLAIVGGVFAIKGRKERDNNNDGPPK